ncbi:hypothetical protein IWX90DRAFT_443531 [Phyllosticta citrichinensis]|uniref:Uncharacterized protein n=1 Tax=Phyllosticta citrichinensis TaxID=1130410 RepID=A0ABR1XIU9_9PEZI
MQDSMQDSMQNSEDATMELDRIKRHLSFRFSKSRVVEELAIEACLEAGYNHDQITTMLRLHKARATLTRLGWMACGINLYRFASLAAWPPKDPWIVAAVVISFLMLILDDYVVKRAVDGCKDIGFHRFSFDFAMTVNVLFIVPTIVFLCM